MVELRYFEIYRSSEYMLLLGQGVRVSLIPTRAGHAARHGAGRGAWYALS